MAASGRRLAAGLVALSISALAIVGIPRGAAGQDAAPPPPIGPERSIGDEVIGVAPDRQWLPDIAAGDGGYLAVWVDERRCCGRVVYASRIDLEGNILDPVGIPIGDPLGGYDWDPHVAWDGSNYLVVWESSDGIEGVRVSPGGEVLDSTRIPIGTFDVSGGAAVEPSVSSTGDGWLVVWAGCPAGDGDGCKVDIHAAIVDADGTVTDRFVLVDEPLRQDAPDVTAGEDEYLFLWHSGPYNASEHWMMMLDERGRPTTEAATHPGAGSLAAYNSESFLLVWSTGDQGDLDVVGARVTRSGEVIDSPPMRIVSGNANRYASAVAVDGEGGWVVVSHSGLLEHRLFGSHVSGDGEVRDPKGTLLVDRPESEHHPALASNGTLSSLVWTGFPDAHRGIYDREEIYAISGNFDDLGEAVPRLVTAAPNSQTSPSIAWNGEVFLAAWEDSRGDRTSPGIYVTRITPEGEVLDGSGIRVSTDSILSFGGRPTVASDGNGFLVAWDHLDRERNAISSVYRDIYAARVTSEGEVIDKEPIAVSTAPETQWDVHAVWTGASYFLAWEDHRSEDQVHADEYAEEDSADIYGARVTPGGDVRDPEGIPLAEGKRDELYLDVATREGTSLVTWSRWCLVTDEPCSYDVFGARVAANGKRLGPRLKIATSSDYHDRVPSVTATDRGFLVAWTRYTVDESVTALREISDDGLGTTRLLTSFVGPQFRPELDWAGDYATLVWEVNPECVACGGDLFATRVASSGEPIDDEPVTVASEAGYEQYTQVASTGFGCSALAYERQDAAPTFGVTRAFVKLFGDC